MEGTKTIVLVLRSGGDFKFRDVELIARHINGKWQENERPRIICLWDKAEEIYDLGNILILPLKTDLPGTWSRIQLYSPEMEQYRPFLYVDLDTAIITSIEKVFELVKEPTDFITLEDFWQRGQLATGLVWFPANSFKVKAVWDTFNATHPAQTRRMDPFLRQVVKPDKYWQQLTTTIYDFKPEPGRVLTMLPADADLVCFHGKPRIFDAATASINVAWVARYVEQSFDKIPERKRVTVIIPYKVDRGWLKEAIASVPKSVQLLVSQGDGNWPTNFNKVLPLAEGDYIKYLHEDDMLTENCIEDSVKAIEEQNADFIHGNALELFSQPERQIIKEPKIHYPTLEDLLKNNVIHSASTMYRRDVFNKVGVLNESLTSSEEYEFNLRCLKYGLKIGYCPTTLGIYRRHPAQKVRSTPKSQLLAEHNKIVSLFQ